MNPSLRAKIEWHLKAMGWVALENGYWRHPERGFATPLAPQGAVAWQIEREECEVAS